MFAFQSSRKDIRQVLPLLREQTRRLLGFQCEDLAERHEQELQTRSSFREWLGDVH